MFTYNSLNVTDMTETKPGHARDERGDYAHAKGGGGALGSTQHPEPPELRAAILSLTAAVSRIHSSRDQHLAAHGSVACNNFATTSKCRFGDVCRFSHSTVTTPDARMRSGKMLPHFEKAIDEFLKKPYADRMAAINRPTQRKLTVLSLKTSLADAQREIALLKESASAHTY